MSDRQATPWNAREHVAYFGYGSLVSRLTHRTEIVDAFPARLVGWRRLWRPRPDMPGFPAALLTIEPAPGSTCDGLLVIDLADNLPAIDAREARYDRLPVNPAELHTDAALGNLPVFVYVAQRDVPVHPQPPRILRSYLDAVMHGFETEHGEAGLRRFLEETVGFDTPIEDDRARPLYPRALPSDPERAERYDALLRRLGLASPPGEV